MILYSRDIGDRSDAADAAATEMDWSLVGCSKLSGKFGLSHIVCTIDVVHITCRLSYHSVYVTGCSSETPVVAVRLLRCKNYGL